MTDFSIRWHQRLNNYHNVLQQLAQAVMLAKSRSLSDLEKQGLIQTFEFTHELAWNVLKDYFFFQGNAAITGSRDATREAYNKGLITAGETWMEMIKSRNQSSHTYNHQIAEAITQKIIDLYYPCFQNFLEKMNEIKANDEK